MLDARHELSERRLMASSAPAVRATDSPSRSLNLLGIANRSDSGCCRIFRDDPALWSERPTASADSNFFSAAGSLQVAIGKITATKTQTKRR
jgi:hypothetical protein